MIAFAVVLIFAVTINFFPLAEPIFWLLFVIALPWLVVRALTFNARNSMFKNIRFDFKGNYGDAIMVFVVMPLVTAVTLGLGYPYFVYRQKQFVVANSGFGVSYLGFDAKVKSFYGVYIKAFGMLLVIAIAYMVFSPTVVIPTAHGAGQPAAMNPAQNVLIMAMVLMMIPLYIFIGTYIQTTVANLFLNGAHIEQQRLKSALKTKRMFWIYSSNLVAIIVSCGLLIPWAKIRLARYRFENLSLETSGRLDTFVAGMQQQVKATGEELVDVLDVDLGL